MVCFFFFFVNVYCSSLYAALLCSLFYPALHSSITQLTRGLTCLLPIRNRSHDKQPVTSAWDPASQPQALTLELQNLQNQLKQWQVLCVDFGPQWSKFNQSS